MKTENELLQPTELERELHTEEDYDNMLDECYEGIFNLLPSRILSECDPIAYSCGFSDYQKYETVYICPICDEEHDNEDDALYCCQSEAE